MCNKNIYKYLYPTTMPETGAGFVLLIKCMTISLNNKVNL